jgi:hypothetical protein
MLVDCYASLIRMLTLSVFANSVRSMCAALLITIIGQPAAGHYIHSHHQRIWQPTAGQLARVLWLGWATK